MKINGKTLLTLVPDANQKLSYSAAISLTQKRWCARVFSAGYCTAQCEHCIDNIRTAFNRLNNATDIKNPNALYTWLIRDEATKFIEKAREAEKHEVTVERDIYDRPTQRNPFLQFIDQMET